MERCFSDYINLLELGLFTLISLFLLLLLLVIIPGFFIWFALALVGKKRSLFRCGFANLVAFVASAFITTILSSVPFLIILSPLIFALLYLWIFKEILDLGWLHAIFAVIISILCVIVLSMIFSIIFSTIFRLPWIPNFRF